MKDKAAEQAADLYALTHCGNAGDAEFYAGLCGRKHRVLELGTGYGRLLPALSRASGSVVGLEIDGALLHAARAVVRALPERQRRSITLTRGDMQDFAFDSPFDRIFLPYNALYCLLTPRSLKRCLRSVRAALVPGGVLAFDVWNADAFHHAGPATARAEREPLFAVQHASRIWDVFEHTRLNRARQRLDAHYRYLLRGRGQEREIQIPQRYFLSTELFAVLRSEGFTVCSKQGDFSGARFASAAPHLVVTATHG